MFLQILSLIFSIVTIGFLLTLAFGFAVDSWTDYKVRTQANLKTLGEKEFCEQLKTFSWWFSEDKATMNLIRNLADQDCRSRDSIRKQWHRDRDPKAEEASE